MLVCVPTNTDAGIDAAIHNHFGSAPFFTLFDTETKDCQVIENKNAHHSHGTCHPMTRLAKYKIDAVVCAGMGRRAVMALNSEGIRAVITEAASAREAVEMVVDGRAKDIDPAKACHGHGQQQQADHEHGECQHVESPVIDMKLDMSKRGLPGLGAGKGSGSGQGSAAGSGRGSGRGAGIARGRSGRGRGQGRGQGSQE